MADIQDRETYKDTILDAFSCECLAAWLNQLLMGSLGTWPNDQAPERNWKKRQAPATGQTEQELKNVRQEDKSVHCLDWLPKKQTITWCCTHGDLELHNLKRSEAFVKCSVELWKKILEANSKAVVQVTIKCGEGMCCLESPQSVHCRDWLWILVLKWSCHQPPPLYGWHQTVDQDIGSLIDLTSIHRA